jgi:hypothetical protein
LREERGEAGAEEAAIDLVGLPGHGIEEKITAGPIDRRCEEWSDFVRR